MKKSIARWRWFVLAVVGFIAFFVAAFALAPQRVIPMGSFAGVASVSVDDIAEPSLQLAPIRPERLVFLELLDFGHSPGSPEADELNYDRLGLGDGILSRGGYEGRETSVPPRYRDLGCASGPLVITGRTKIAMNLARSDTAENAAPRPLVVDTVPWEYTTYGTPCFAHHPRSRAGWLHHRLTIRQVADDGSVVLTASHWRVLLRPGGQVTLDRTFGWWSSTVTIRNRGIVSKDRIRRSAGLRVED
jgi:hypothetical protein